MVLDWYGHVWINPPYGRGINEKWARKVYQESQREKVKTVTALIPASTSSNWYQKYYCEADLFTYIDHKIEFEGDVDGTASFDNVICTFGKEYIDQDYISALDDLGTVKG